MATTSELADTEQNLTEALHDYLRLRGVATSTIYFVEDDMFEVVDRACGLEKYVREERTNQ